MNELTAITQSSFSLQSAALLGMYLITGAYIIFSVVLYYHWNTYSTDERVSKMTLIAFFVTTFPLLLIMALLLLVI
jgi:hypothetical protein